MVGELSYLPHLHGRAMTCLLMPLGGSTEPLIQLYACKIKIKKGGILIGGEEDHWKRKNRESYLQTLWAWAIPPEGMSIRVLQPSNLASDGLRDAMR